MSDTSVMSARASYDYERRRMKTSHHHSSFCERYWFHTVTTLLMIIILAISGVLGYVLYKQYRREQERRRIRSDFKRENGVASKVLDVVKGDGVVGKWLKANQGPVLKIFQAVMKEMVETIFE